MQISVNEVLSQVLSLKVGRKVYKINKNPQWEVLAKADKYKDLVFEEVKYNNWLSEREAILFLIQEKVIPEDYDTQLKEIERSIDGAKKSLYKSRNDDKSINTLKKKIKGLNILYMDLISSVHSLDYVTLDYYLEYMREIFLIANTVIDGRVNFQTAELLFANKQKKLISHEDIRNFAKTNPWKSYWSANKPNVIKHDILNHEQTALIMFSKMYDSVYEHPECPEDFVIQDNDMLDGWLLLTKEKQEREKRAQEIDNKNPKFKNATEIFLPAQTQEERERISMLNTENAKAKKMVREQMISNEKEVSDIQFAKKGLLVK